MLAVVLNDQADDPFAFFSLCTEACKVEKPMESFHYWGIVLRGVSRGDSLARLLQVPYCFDVVYYSEPQEHSSSS